MAHGFVTFRGVTAHLEVQVTLTHGISPSQFLVQVPPGTPVQEAGTFSLVFGGTRIDFPDCKVDRVDLSHLNGLRVWNLTLLDRRWKWKDCGQISGYYNIREGDATNNAAGIPRQIRKGTEKNLRELMKLCLDAMGEKSANISQVPKDIYPEIEWDYENPAVALAKLADMGKFRIVLTLANRIELWPSGVGKQLTTQQAIDYEATIDPPERPDSLIFAGSRKLYECDIPLEAVCRSTKGEWLPINDPGITYKPETKPIDGNYWCFFDSDFGNDIFDTPVTTVHGIKTLRDLAKADVYRKYRPKLPAAIPGLGTIETIDRIAPLLPYRLRPEEYTQANKSPKPRPPVVWGVFSREEAPPEMFRAIADPVRLLDAKGNPPAELTIEEGIQVDERTGLVSFDRPRYQFGKSFINVEASNAGPARRVDAYYMKPCQLWLRIGFGVRDMKTRAWKHHEITRKLSGRTFGTGARYVKSEDAILRSIVTRDGVEDNLKEYTTIANHYLDQEERKYETRDPCSATYPGLLAIQPDGAIQQITWSITERGATTHVSRNREEPALGLTYEEQLMYRRILDKLSSDPLNSRIADDKAKRRPA